MEITFTKSNAFGPAALTVAIPIQRGGTEVGLLRGIFWVAAAAATGGLALAILPSNMDGIDGYDGGSDDD